MSQLPPPPRPGHARAFETPHAPLVRVQVDDVWCAGRLVGLRTDAAAAVWGEVVYLDAGGLEHRATFPGHEVREPA